MKPYGLRSLTKGAFLYLCVMLTHNRKLTPSDTQAYRAIRLECLKNFPGNFSSTFEDESKKPKLAFEIYIEEQGPDAFMMGAFDNEKLVGICGFFREQKVKCRHVGNIIQMYVQPEYAGKGVGQGLLGATITESLKNQEIEQLTLGVVTSNKAANKLYEKLGFKEYGVHKGQFKNGDQYADQRFMVLCRDTQPQPKGRG